MLHIEDSNTFKSQNWRCQISNYWHNQGKTHDNKDRLKIDKREILCVVCVCVWGGGMVKAAVKWPSLVELSVILIMIKKILLEHPYYWKIHYSVILIIFSLFSLFWNSESRHFRSSCPFIKPWIPEPVFMKPRMYTKALDLSTAYFIKTLP
jgi:hypothetical protein